MPKNQLVPDGTWEFAGESLHVNRATVESLVRRKSLSPSTMNALDTSTGGCPARYVADKVLPHDTSLFSPTSVGTLAHSVLEDLYGKAPDERTTQVAAKIAMDVVGRQDFSHLSKDVQDVQRTLLVSTIIEHYKGIFTIENPSLVTPFARELSLVGTELDGVPGTGFIDRVDVNGTGTFEIVDYKTGKVKKASKRFGDPYGHQLRVYAMLLEQKLDRAVDRMDLYFTKHAQAVRVASAPARMRETRALFTQTWEELNTYCNDGEFPTVASGLCSFCPLVNACPVAARNNVAPNLSFDAPSSQELGLLPGRAHLAPELPDDVDPSDEGDSLDDAEPGGTEPDGAEPEFQTHTPPPHIPCDPTEQEGSPMKLWREEQPWNETTDNALNPNSYAASAVVALTTWAMKQLVAADIPVSKTSLSGLSNTLGRIVFDACHELGGHTEMDWQSGLNTRVRNSLFTIIEHVHPIPFGATDDEWETWIARVTRNIVATISVARDMWVAGFEDEGWHAFTGTETADESDEDTPADDADDSDEGGDSEDFPEDDSSILDNYADMPYPYDFND